MMTTPKIFEIDVTTGESILREMTPEELQTLEADRAIKLQEIEESNALNLAKAELLKRLNISEEEARLLIS